MSLSAQQLEARNGKLTASRIGTLMNGSPEDVVALWQEMVGLREPDDLSDIWAVQLGTETERLNLAWYEHKTGVTLTRHGEVVVCPRAPWAACTLDAFDPVLNGPVEAKHVGGFEPRDRVIARYTPQVHWQMLCTETRQSVQSIIEGAREPIRELIAFDEAYAAELWMRAERFMACVNDLVPPLELPPAPVPVPQEQWRSLNMALSNSWAQLATQWLENRDAAKLHEGAAKELKALVEPDVGFAFGHGIQCKRSKAGSLTLSAMKG